MECRIVAAIQEPMLNSLKAILIERYVPYLPPLLGDAPPANKPEKQTSRAFSAFVLQTLFDLDPRTASQSVVDDYNDNGLDAIYYHEDEKTLYIIQSKLKASEQFQLAEAQSFMAGVKLLINMQFETFNQNVKNLKTNIEAALDQCDQIKLIIAYTGDGISIQASNAIRQAIQDEQEDGEEQLQLEIIEFNAGHVEEALRQEQAIRLVNDKIRIHKYRTVNQPRKTIFGIVKITDLIDLDKKYGKRLYEKNIRYFIGAGLRGVNSAIKHTLLNAPADFLYLNNGITLIGNSIKQRSRSIDNKTTRDFEILGLSVVNGAQTISTAAQFTREHPNADISAAQVMVTIVNTGSGEFHKQVTRSRNLQNPVDLSNFAALDDNQERLRREIALYGVNYHYRSQRQEQTGIPVITIDALAKALACLNKDIRYPAYLKSSPRQFSSTEADAYKQIFTVDLFGCKAINTVTVYGVIQELLTMADKSSPSPERLIYRHCGYALASLLMKRLKAKIEGAEILTEGRVKTLISAPFDELRQLFSDHYQIIGNGSAPHAFFKRIPDTASLIQDIAITHQEMSEDQAVQSLQGQVTADDPYNQKLTNYLSGKAKQIQEA